MTASGTGRFPVIGRKGSAERRAMELQSVMETHVELVLAATKAALASGWLDEQFSPLGKERHVAIVLSRIARARAEGRSPVGAAIVAGRHLLSIEAVADEVFAPPSRATLLARAMRALGRGGAHNDTGPDDGARGAGNEGGRP
jgi:hypothetical protein